MTDGLRFGNYSLVISYIAVELAVIIATNAGGLTIFETALNTAIVIRHIVEHPAQNNQAKTNER
jgi:hypothetical protein